MIKRMKEKPIIFKDGKRVNLSVGGGDWIDGDVVEKELEYIAKMSEGLSTGTMSDDVDYVELKNEVVKDLIKKRTISLKNDLNKSAKSQLSMYEKAVYENDKVKNRMQDYAQQIAKNNSTSFLVDSNGVHRVAYTPVRPSIKPYWTGVDMEKLGKEIKERQKAGEKISFQDMAYEQMGWNKSEKKVAKKKVAKKKKSVDKKVAKKKSVKKKKKIGNKNG